jgi:hypothetical protein
MANDIPKEGGPRGGWAGDALDRKRYADFLTARLARAKSASDGGSRSFTLALDAGWGQGKSFFVSRWARDLREAFPPRPVVMFDAWAADHAADPVIAFMAALSKALREEIGALGLGAKAEAAAKAKVRDAVRLAGRAIAPASKLIATGVIKKLTGVAAEEVIQAFADPGPPSTEGADKEGGGGAGGAALGKGMDKLFEEALKEQSHRGELIKAFREKVASALLDLAGGGQRELPLFVFIDELDRCRPDFAIGLLEGLKHIFGIDGVVFVVSVNLAQLSQSVRAIYGAGFEGFDYLERFFDMRYGLPPATGIKAASALLGGALDLEGVVWETGLPDQGFVALPLPNKPETAVAWVFDTLALDLRSRAKTLEMILGCAAGIPQGRPVHILWLAFLCAIRHLSPEAFEQVASGAPDGLGKALEARAAPGASLLVREDAWIRPDHRAPALRVSLGEALAQYHSAATRPTSDLVAEINAASEHPYPASILLSILPNSGSGHALRGYFRLVRTAGQMLTD